MDYFRIGPNFMHDAFFVEKVFQVFNAFACDAVDSDNVHIASKGGRNQIVIEQLRGNSMNGFVFIDILLSTFRYRHHSGEFRVVNELQTLHCLLLHAIVSCDDQQHDIRGRGSTFSHGCERCMAWRIDERNHIIATQLHVKR